MLYLCMWFISFKRIISVSLPPLCILSMLYLIMFQCIYIIIKHTNIFVVWLLFVSLCDVVLMLCWWWQLVLVCQVCSARNSKKILNDKTTVTGSVRKTPRKVILTEIWGCGYSTWYNLNLAISKIKNRKIE